MELRPMREPDVPAVHAVAEAAFADLDRRNGRTPGPPGRADWAHARTRRLMATDPGGAWVAEAPDGAFAGAALALVREGVWGLSLLVVAPGHQSAGVGRALLDRALAYGDTAGGGIILASSDPRALRAYARAGFALEPALTAAGRPHDAVVADSAVRGFEPGDHPLAAAVDRTVRGAAHGADLDALMAAGGTGLVLPGGGYAITRADEVKIVAAHDEEAAAVLLRAALAALGAAVPGRARRRRPRRGARGLADRPPGLGRGRRARRRARAARGRRGVRARRRGALPAVPADGVLPVGSPS
jgi:GNAT superfamily N-acetyltransferase